MTHSLDRALEYLASGRIIVLTGDKLRGGDMDFALSARFVTPEAVNFMAVHGRGLICLALTPERAARLGIELINPGSERQSGRPFGRSIEASTGITTGISAADRARTIEVAMDEKTTAADLVSPGHVFPLIANPGGVRARGAAVEGAIDLCRLADAGDAAVICSIMRDDGEMARPGDIAEMVEKYDLAMADIGDLIRRLDASS